MIHSKKFDYRYMRFAKAIAAENDTCYSRQLGCLIVDPNHKIRGLSYNGPPRGTPHTDTEKYIKNYLWPQLTEDQIESLRLMFNVSENNLQKKFIEKYKDCKICPRRILGCKSGEQPLLCSCIHAEQNAIANSENIVGCVMYCSTPIPCLQCAGLIINAGIAEVHCYNVVYHEQSKWLFQQANVALITYEQGEI